MKRTAFRLSLTAMALLAVATPAAALVDLDLVVQMPLAVVEVEDAGYPRDDLALLASGLVASELAPAEVIDVLRWAPAVWYLDELADGDLFLAVDPVRVDPLRVDAVRIDAAPRRLRLIEDRDGSWLITTREDLVFLDLADGEIERQWLVDRDVVVRDIAVRDVDVVDRDRRDRLDRDRRLDDRGMGAYVQWLHEQGLRGRELADAIHAELRRRGVPAGPKDRFDGPPPASPRFVVERLPDVLVVDGRLVELRDRDDQLRLLPPVQARERLAAAPRFEGVRLADGRLARAPRAEGRDGRDVVARGRGRDDRGGGPPDHAAANRGGGPGRDDRAEGGGQGRRGGGQGKADAGGGGQGRGKGKAVGGGGGGGQGKGKARAGGGGQGKGKGKGGGGGGGGQGKGGGGKGKGGG